jgi:mannose-6-phosphate isomerase-like protein (cupin superfamily)
MNVNVKLTKPQPINHKWGEELLLHNEQGYSTKIITLILAADRTPMQYHLQSKKILYVNSGVFRIEIIDVETGKRNTRNLNIGEVVEIGNGTPYQIVALSPYATLIDMTIGDGHIEKDTYIIYNDTYIDLQ